ncbi:Hypothetical protein HDN1F_33630 [gamma proteobacterium HdN1]|nr:Hypothetical protein HDN1F_33630 [gamma proteobacterium HdN1]
MLSLNEYETLWGVYCAASLFAIFAFWGLVNPLPGRPLRNLLRGLFAVFLLAPVDAAPASGDWAPAALVTFFGLFSPERVLPLVGPSFFFGAALVLILVLADFLILQSTKKVAPNLRGARY